MRKKGMAVLLAAALTAGMLSGCSTNTGSGGSGVESAQMSEGAAGTVDTSKEVELVMYVISDRPAAQDSVDENLNKLL